MKKILASISILALAAGVYAETAIRVVESAPETNSVLSIKMVRPSLLKSIYCDISATAETNSYTITYLSADGDTRTLATAVADVIETETFDNKNEFYNYDADSSTGLTEWLQAGDTLKLTSNDGSNTAYSNITYRVVLEELK